ncbi:hypothetical protein [Glutamicibacter soli]
MKKAITTATLLAAIALTGCTAGNQSATLKPAPAGTLGAVEPIASSPTLESASPAPATWGDDAMSEFLTSYERDSFKEFSDGTPHQNIQKWEVEDAGKLHVWIADRSWQDAQVRWLALDILERTFLKVKPLERITVSVVDDETMSKTVEITDF